MTQDWLADDTEIERRLRSRLWELERLSQDSGESRAAVELDQTRVGRLSRMDALQGQAMAQATEARRQQEIRRLEAALQRLADGEYGACTVCGEEIAPKRLGLDPATPSCVDCAAG
ncbi:TraR/DksA family transcriptional regulator [Algihabitans albus]|uniref:TraR/DksA family transcriptional regulator n=1 Tax=Algihabitans albus TaxID=2164067 RepID=UPI000E5CEB3E|nr:TraR/DksA C4-type zinc finger protein [Algihabitans albus]